MIDFDNPNVSKIYNNVISNEEYLTSTKLKEGMEQLYSLLFGTDQPPYEAYLLYTYFLSKEKLYYSAIDILNNIDFNDLSPIEAGKVIFIKNIILSGKDHNYLVRAIKNCEEQKIKDPDNPRWYIQKGFFIWRGIKNMQHFPYSKTHICDEWIAGVEIAERTNCHKIVRIGLADLCLYFFEEDNLDDFEEYFLKLKEYQKDTVEGPVWIFIKALNNWLRARDVENVNDKMPFYTKSKDQINKAISIFKNPFYRNKLVELEEELKNVS